MANIKEILVAAIFPAVKAIGKMELGEVLQKVETNNNRQVYVNALKSIHSNFTLLKEVAVKTKTKIDDGIIDIILETVEEAAEDDGVTL